MTTEDLQPVDEALLRGDETEQGDEVEQEAVEEVVAEEEVVEPVAEAPKAEDETKPIPQERFNQVWAERKALMEENKRLKEQYEAQPEAMPAVDIKTLSREASKALLEGDTDKHDELQDKIHDELLRRAEQQAEIKLTQRSEANAFKARAAELTATYPVLNPETGDPEAIEMVIELRDGYIAKGMNMTEALEKAVLKVAPRFSTSAQPEAGKPDARTLAAVQRGAKDSNSVPPQGGGVGNRALPPVSTKEPTQAEWDAMTDTQREKALAAA